ncbi:MAG: glycosyltransferase family 4 protein [Candidatus Krumholzibacteria bacterium]|nr:glycosyltransferase family 4 protein [Candidatus Krumholzibacteria bacterium]
MKILAVNWRDIGDPLGGGAELHLHHILAGAAAAGHEVELIASAYAGAPADEVRDGVVMRRRGDWRVANFVLPWVVRRRLRDQAWALLIEDINKIPFYTPLYAGPVPVLAIVPHLFGRTVYRETNPLAATYVWAGEWPLPIVYRNAWFEVISESTAVDLAARGLPRERITVVHCGLDHDRFALASPPPRATEPLLVCWSRLRRYKSNDVAIRAFDLIRRELAAARLLVMGRGPDEGRLRRLVAHLGLTAHVEFTGHLPGGELVDRLHRAHLCLNPSPKEGWGLTVIEANRCGVPVIASDRPGLRDSVRDEQTGLLVPYGDPRAMAQAALRLLYDRDLWSCFSDAAVAWAKTFSWPRCVSASLALCERVAAEKRRPS